MLFVPNKQSPILVVVIGLVLLLGCFWVLEKSVRLLTGRKHKGGLMAPKTLRIVSFFLLAMPIAGLFTGYYRTMGLLAIFQALSYIVGSFGLRALARNREAKENLIDHELDGADEITVSAPNERVDLDAAQATKGRRKRAER